MLESLNAGHLAAYAADGFVRLPDVLCADEIAGYEQEITRLVRHLSPAQRLAQIEADNGEAMRAMFEQHLSRTSENTPASTYDAAFTQVMNLWRHSAIVESLVRHPLLTRFAAQLMQVEGVRVYHDQALYKEAHGGHTPWHVDQFYWPLSSEKTVTAWIPLQAVPMEMGPLAFAAASHSETVRQQAGELAISDESERILAGLMSGYEVVERPFSLGEVSFHAGWTCHRAGPNNTDQTRAAFTVIYMDQDIQLIQPQHRNHAADAAMWTPGVQPGEVAASPINPVVYSRH